MMKFFHWTYVAGSEFHLHIVEIFHASENLRFSICSSCFKHNGTLYPLAFHLATHLVNLVDGLMKLIRIGQASATTVKFGETRTTGFLRVNTGSSKMVGKVFSEDALFNVT